MTEADQRLVREITKDKVDSDITGITGATQITNMVKISQTDYDAGTPIDGVFYVIPVE